MRHDCGSSERKLRKLAAIAAIAGASFGGARWGGGPFAPFPPGFRGGGRHGDGHGGGRRGPGRGRQFGRGELRLLLLTLIAEQPRHGYDLIKAMEERSGGHYAPSPGVIYPALAMLADEGLIAEEANADPRRKFALTDAGRAVLAQEQAEADAAVARLRELGEQAERHRAPSIERAGANLFTALRQRVESGGEADLPHRIAEILDEAARKIERL